MDNAVSTSRFTPFPWPPGTLTPEPSIYFGVDDFLELAVRNAASGVTVLITGLLFLPDGSRSYFSQPLTPSTDRTPSSIVFQPGEGWLRSLMVQIFAGTVKRGQCYVTVYMQKGTTTQALKIQQLIGNYASNAYSPSWPHTPLQSQLDGHGFFRSITGTDPAAGVEIVETVPALTHWHLWSFNYRLVAAVAVVNRFTSLVIDDGTNIIMQKYNSTAQTTGQTIDYSWGLWSQGTAIASLFNTLTFAHPIPLLPGYRIRTITNGLQAGDDYGAPQYYVEEFSYF